MVSAVSSISNFGFQNINQVQRQSPEERFSNADSDNDGGLSLEEYSNFAPKFVDDIEGSFSNIDSDGDGSLTEAELKSFAEEQGPPKGGKPPPPQNGDQSLNSQSSLIEELFGNLSNEEQQTVSDFFGALISLQEEAQTA